MLVVAATGQSLRVAPGAAAYDYWKPELSSRLIEGDRFFLADFPDQRAYGRFELD